MLAVVLLQVPFVSLTVWDFENPLGTVVVVGGTSSVLCAVLRRLVTFICLLVTHLWFVSCAVKAMSLRAVLGRSGGALRSVKGTVTTVGRSTVTLLLRCLLCAMVEAKCVLLTWRVLVVRPVVSVQVTLQVLQRVILRYKMVELMHVIPLDLLGNVVMNASVVTPSHPLRKTRKSWKAAQPRKS